MRYLRFIVLFLMLNSIATEVSSATKVKPLIDSEQKLLGDDKGLLLIGLETSRDLKSIHLSGPTNIILTSEHIKSGSQYLLVDLKAGIYTIKKIRLDNVRYLKFKDTENWEFSIKPGVINYVGHFELVQMGFFASSGAAVELVNRSSEALQFLQLEYPSTLKRNRIKYAGPGEDDFFDFLYRKKMIAE